jgi:hypothetical protein
MAATIPGDTCRARKVGGKAGAPPVDPARDARYESAVRIPLALALLIGIGGCYDQPTVPRDKPLSCASTADDECPTGYACIANRVCALKICASDLDCPVGLVCPRGSCAQVTLDGGADTGAIGVAPGEGTESPDGGDAGLEAGAADAPVPVDLFTPADAAGPADTAGPADVTGGRE